MTKLLLIAALLLSSCAQPVIQHPGAVNSFDNYAYDTLRVEEIALNKAKADTVVQNNPTLKAAYELAKTQYNTTITAYKTYHLSAVAGSNPDTTALAASIAELVLRVTKLLQLGVAKP